MAATRTTSPRRSDDLSHYGEVLIPFLVSRQIYAGAGKVLQTARGSMFAISQRAEHIWEGVSSATTRSRPIINTRDEPHADAEHYRRLHVIVGDSNMSEYTTFLKVGAMAVLLRMVEDPSCILRDMTPREPDPGHPRDQPRPEPRPAEGAPGLGARRVTALEIQSRVPRTGPSAMRETHGFPRRRDARRWRMWEHVMTHLESDPFKLDTELDWVIKHNLIEAYRAKHDLPLSHAKVSLLDLQYHDIRRENGLFYKLQDHGRAERTLTDAEMFEAIDTPPQSTRAKLRGDFIRKAKEKKRDYTVDWVHLKLNDQAQRTVLCKDPFRSEDDRVAKLIDSL